MFIRHITFIARVQLRMLGLTVLINEYMNDWHVGLVYAQNM